MPPIKSTFVPRHVQVQMDALRKQYHGLEGLISRLNNLTGSPLSVQQELARSARVESKAIESKIEVTSLCTRPSSWLTAGYVSLEDRSDEA